MVEVIKRNETRKQITCHSCGSVLEYSPSDEFVDVDYDHLLRYEIHHYLIICPACKRKVKTRERVYDML